MQNFIQSVQTYTYLSHQSLNVRRDSLLLLHTLTIADRFLQDWSFSRKYAIVIDQELISETGASVGLLGYAQSV